MQETWVQSLGREDALEKEMAAAAAAAAAKSLQSCPTLCNPTDGSPLGSSVPGILQTRILEWVAEGNGYTLHILAWKIPWTEEPGRLQSTGSRRVGHN